MYLMYIFVYLSWPKEWIPNIFISGGVQDFKLFPGTMENYAVARYLMAYTSEILLGRF